MRAPDGMQLTIEAVIKQFPTGRGQLPVHALDRIDLHVRTGEFVSLLGPSGCGKSTLLNIIAGFLTPTAGRVLHQGGNRRRLSKHKSRMLLPKRTSSNATALRVSS
jgi:ABC-type sugar transport system ATPase subunit